MSYYLGMPFFFYSGRGKAEIFIWWGEARPYICGSSWIPWA